MIDPLYQPGLRYMVMYLLPRWYGETGEIEALAEQSAESEKQRSDDAIYALIASQTRYFIGSDFFKHFDFSWDRMKQGFIDLESIYPGSLEHTCMFGRFACIGQYPATASIVFQRIGEQWNEDIEANFRNRKNFLRWKSWANGEISFPGVLEIHISARDGDLTALQQLIDGGAELDAIDNSEKTPLMWAIAKYNTDVALYLIEKGADVNAATDKGQTPFLEASAREMFGVMSALMAHGANINAQGEKGWTALQIAAYNNDIEVSEFLLNQPELDVNIQNDHNSTALSIVASAANNEILELMLVRTELNLEHAKEQHGFTALHRAVYYGYDETAKLLVRHRADVTAKTKDGRTPIGIAKRRGHQEMVEFLE